MAIVLEGPTKSRLNGYEVVASDVEDISRPESKARIECDLKRSGQDVTRYFSGEGAGTIRCL